MALLNRFSKLNDRGETGIFTFIVTKSVTRDFHRDATTKDFCFGYHRWAISFQRPTEKVLGVHLLLRNPSPSTSCVVDFSLTLLNREHFSQNEVYTKRQAKFTITNPMQGVPRWIQMSDLTDKRFSNETGEFLFELSLSNITTIFECDIQLSPIVLTQYKSLLKANGSQQQPAEANGTNRKHSQQQQSTAAAGGSGGRKSSGTCSQSSAPSGDLINLETNYFTFGAFDWSLTIVPLVNPSRQPQAAQSAPDSSSGASSSSSSTAPTAAFNSNNNNATTNNLLTPNKNHSSSSLSIASNSCTKPTNEPEPVCRVYLNRLNGLDCLCRVKYRVILGHHNQQSQSQQSSSGATRFVDSKLLDQISDSGGRIRGHQFRSTNILKLISLRSQQQQQQQQQSLVSSLLNQQQQQQQTASSLDLRVHIEMFCANTVSEARVPVQRRANESLASNCSDRNKQAWCVESDCESDYLRLKLFFMDLQSVPRNHIRYISWIAYVVARDSRTGATRESLPVKNSPHSNYYLQDGMDMGTIMETDISVKELNNTNPTDGRAYLDANQLTVHIEWVDSLLLFSHLYNNYDSLATIQRHQIRRELNALQLEYDLLERKYLQSKRSLSQLLPAPSSSPSVISNQSPLQVGAESSIQCQSQTTEQQSCGRKAPSPMSHAERLKFSFSTPPSRQPPATHLPLMHGPTRHMDTQSAAHLVLQTEQQQVSTSLDHHPHSKRRRLPQQPLAAAAPQRVADAARRDSQISDTYQQQQTHMRGSLGSLDLSGQAVTLSPLKAATTSQQIQPQMLEQRRLSPAELNALPPRRTLPTMAQPLQGELGGHYPLQQLHSQIRNTSDRRRSHELYLASADAPHYAGKNRIDERIEVTNDYMRPHVAAGVSISSVGELELEMQSLYLAATGTSAPSLPQSSENGHEIDNRLYRDQLQHAAPTATSKYMIGDQSPLIGQGRRSPNLTDPRHFDEIDYHLYGRYQRL